MNEQFSVANAIKTNECILTWQGWRPCSRPRAANRRFTTQHLSKSTKIFICLNILTFDEPDPYVKQFKWCSNEGYVSALFDILLPISISIIVGSTNKFVPILLLLRIFHVMLFTIMQSHLVICRESKISLYLGTNGLQLSNSSTYRC